MKRIYLAGPEVFYPDPLSRIAYMKSILSDLGLEGLFPIDGQLNLQNMESREIAETIYLANVDLLRSADGVLASMTPFRGPSMDVGTGWEMGFAAATRIPVIGYWTSQDVLRARGITWPEDKLVKKTYADRVADAWAPITNLNGRKVDLDGWLVEDFGLPDNLMVVCGASSIEVDFQDAAVKMAGLLGL